MSECWERFDIIVAKFCGRNTLSKGIDKNSIILYLYTLGIYCTCSMYIHVDSNGLLLVTIFGIVTYVTSCRMQTTCT